MKKSIYLLLLIIFCIHCCSCGKDQCNNDSHRFVPYMVTEPDCDTEGLQKLTCIKCGYEKEAVLPSVEHSYVLVNTIEPTCLENGRNRFLCLKCGSSFEEDIPDTKIDHSANMPSIEKRCVYSNCPLCGTPVYAEGGHLFDRRCCCTRCGRKNIFAHSYTNGTCTYCGDPEMTDTIVNGVTFSIPSKPVYVNGFKIKVGKIMLQEFSPESEFKKAGYWGSLSINLEVTALSKTFLRNGTLDEFFVGRLFIKRTSASRLLAPNPVDIAQGNTSYTILSMDLESSLDPSEIYVLRFGNLSYPYYTDDYWILTDKGW